MSVDHCCYVCGPSPSHVQLGDDDGQHEALVNIEAHYSKYDRPRCRCGSVDLGLYDYALLLLRSEHSSVDSAMRGPDNETINQQHTLYSVREQWRGQGVCSGGL